jgi:uncharacterized membrane protein HdeD (DUF308 family)
LTPAQNPDRLGEHVAGVRAALETGAYDVTVLGHTHKAGRIGGWYFNSGSWTGPRNTFLRISPDGHVRYLEWEDGRAIEREIPVVLPDEGPGRAPVAPGNPVTKAISAARTLFPKPTRPERSRWVLLAQGALAISVGAGVLTISVGQGSAAGWRLLVSAFAAYALVDGALSLLGAPREPPARRLLAQVRGVASLLLGLVVLRRGYVVEAFVILVGVWAFISGALRVAASVVLKGMVESRWLFAAGAGSMLASLVLLFLPASAVLLKLALAGFLCYYGAGQLLAGLFGQRLPRTAGAVSRRT